MAVFFAASNAGEVPMRTLNPSARDIVQYRITSSSTCFATFESDIDAGHPYCTCGSSNEKAETLARMSAWSDSFCMNNAFVPDLFPITQWNHRVDIAALFHKPLAQSHGW